MTQHLFNSRFPGQPVQTSTTMSPFWILLELMMMEMLVTTDATTTRRAQLQSSHHPQTNTQILTGRIPFLLPKHSLIKALKQTGKTESSVKTTVATSFTSVINEYDLSK